MSVPGLGVADGSSDVPDVVVVVVEGVVVVVVVGADVVFPGPEPPEVPFDSVAAVGAEEM